MVIAVTNLKGGVGKTTIATNLAVSFAHRQKKVCVVDTDIFQKSSLEWAENRDAAALRIPIFSVTEKQLNKEVEALRKNYDIVFIDGTPQLAELASRTILASDIILVPLSPSIYDFRSFENFLTKYNEVKTIKESIGKIQAYVIVNRVNESANVSKEITEALREHEIPVMNTRLANRIAYVDSATNGLGVIEYKDPKAKAEMNRLTDELEICINNF